jgi:hypothetical protein
LGTINTTSNLLTGTINTSNIATSNILLGTINTTSNLLTGIINSSNIAASNFTNANSNILLGTINASNIAASNFTRDNSNILLGTINTTSNLLREVINSSNLISSNYTNNQIYNSLNVLDLGLEQQYPPKEWNISTNLTPVTLLSQSCFTQTFTINSYTNGYGIGTYRVYTSSYYYDGLNYSQKELFNHSLLDVGGHWTDIGNYSGGVYNKTTNYINNNYYGEWFIIQLPVAIILTKFQIYMRPSNTTRAPAEWRIYGSTDGITFTEILEARQGSRLTVTDYVSNSYYIKILASTFTTPYTYFGMAVNKLIGTSETTLNFSEFLIFGKEPITYINKYLTYNGTAQIFKGTLTNTGTIINNGIIYGNGTISAFSFTQDGISLNSLLTNNLTNSSNYTNATSNILLGKINTNETISSNFTSNYTNATSNILLGKINTNETLSSNFTSNYTNATSNILLAKMNTYETISSNFTSNYTNATSNILLAKMNTYETISSNFTSNYTYENLNILDISIQKIFPPKLYNSSSPQSITTRLNQTPIYYENITIINDGSLTYGSGIYDIYSSSIDTNNISFTGTASSNAVANNPDYAYIMFTNNGTLTLTTSTICDIFMIGGGGGGGYNHGGGGGAGAYYYGSGIPLNSGTYNINIGSGGNGGTGTIPPASGGDTYITFNGSSDLTIGGLNVRCKGGGGSGFVTTIIGLDGGCGGGADGWSGNGAANVNTYRGGYTNNSGTVGSGFAGGSARQYFANGQLAAGGGGGIGSVGQDAIVAEGGNGGNARVIDITGIETVYGGGGGGGEWIGNVTTSAPAGLGGSAMLSNGTIVKVGGDSPRIEGANGGDAIINTGSGGGGGKGGRGGNGSSGVVIIRFLKSTTKKELFNFNINDNTSCFKSFQYDTASTTNNGYYLTTDRYILPGYYGDWIIIKIPYPIYLNKYRIYNTSAFIGKSPSLFKIYGSSDGLTYEEIIKASNDTTALISTDYTSLGYYEKIVDYYDETYTHFGIVVNKIIGNNTNSHQLNINEFQIYGRETTPSFIPRYLLFNSTTQNFTGTLTNSGTIINNGAINGSGTISAFSFTQNGTPLNTLLTNNFTNSCNLTNATSNILLGSINTSNIAASNFTNATSNILLGSINTSNIAASNFTNANSNILVTRINTSNVAASNFTNANSNILLGTINTSNIAASNYTNATSNILLGKINTNETLSSNFTSNYTNAISNILLGKINTNETLSSNFTSNYIYENLNVLDNNIQKLFPPKIYNSASPQSITTYLNQTPVYYENIILTTANIEYGSGTYDIYTSSIDTNNITFTSATLNNVPNNDDYAYLLFTNNGTLSLNTSIVCDILIVGGGGGGGVFAGGGGAGGVLFARNYTVPNGTHTITVGTGGSGGPISSILNGSNGNNSSFAIDGGATFIAVGGGGGGARNDSVAGSPGRPGNVGGSGGGGAHSDTSNATPTNIGGISNKNNYPEWISYGNSGGSGINGNVGVNGYGSGGGGGAGSIGSNAGIRLGGNGGAGIDMSSYFGTLVGHNGWFGGGGAGGSGGGGVSGFGNGGNGLFGGGGNAFSGNGLANTGGGGGGGDYSGAAGYGGNGGSGVVIIRFLKSTTKKELFNYITNDNTSYFKSFQYDTTINANNGYYLTTDRYILSGYYGDWIIIKIPYPIYLRKYRIYNTSSFVGRSPSLFKIYGSSDGSTYEEITIASNDTTALTTSDYLLGYYEKIVDYFVKTYTHFGIVVKKIIGNNINSHLLNINEFQIYGRETTPIYVPRYLLFDSTTQNFTGTLTNSGNIINTGTISGNGTISAFSFTQNGTSLNTLLSNTFTNSCNLTNATCNLLLGSINLSNIASSNFTRDNSNILLGTISLSNTIASNFTNTTSNILLGTISLSNTIASNFTNTTSNILLGTISLSNIAASNFTNATSNILLGKINTNETLSSNFTSNYTYENLNVLDTSIQKIFPPKIYNAASPQSITTYLNQTPVYYENITVVNDGSLTYGSGIYDIYTSSIDTNNITFSGTATSNAVTNNNDYAYVMFTNNGTLSLNSSIVCDILIVGGGGGGGYDGGGGGGGGQVLYYTNDNVSFKSGNAVTLSPGTYNINIGSGGLGKTSIISRDEAIANNGTNGGTTTIINSSTLATILSAKGGGAGGSRNNVGNGGDVGGTGGVGHNNEGTSPASLNSGGTGGSNGSANIGGGGGGGGANINALKNGEDSQSNRAGNGGAGVDINIIGTSTGYGGGGGGGSYAYPGGTATHGGGGGNITQYGIAFDGSPNTGGGGGSGGHAQGYPNGKNGGSGVVIIRFLKSTTKKELFNFITIDNTSYFKSFQYDTASTANNGYYLTTDRYILNGYYGDWIIIKIPYSIYLSKYRIYNTPAFIGRSPSLFKIYGSTDGTTYEEIVDASNNTTQLTALDYPSGYYEKNVNYFVKTYTHFGIVVKKIIGGNSNSHLLNISEFQIYGRDTTISYIPKYLLFNSTTQNFTGTLTNSGTIINNGAINGNGTIAAFSFTQNGTPLNTLLDAKQPNLTASTILSGIGSNLTLINYQTLSNLPNLSQYAQASSLSSYVRIDGTTTMTAALNITSTTSTNQLVITNTAGSNYASIRFFNGSQNGYIGIGGTQITGTYERNFFIESSNSIVFSTGGANTATSPPRMILNSVGNLGIGTTNPFFPLTVIGNSYISGFLGIGTTNTQTSNLFIAGNANTAILGKVGIGTTDTSNFNLNVFGSLNVLSISSNTIPINFTSYALISSLTSTSNTLQTNINSKQDLLTNSTTLIGIGSNLSLINYATLSNLPNFNITGATGGNLSYASGTITLAMPTNYTDNISLSNLITPTTFTYKGNEISSSLLSSNLTSYNLNVYGNTLVSGFLNQTNLNQSNIFLGGVGIGTTDPSSYKLNVAGDFNAASISSNGIPINFSSYVTTNQLYGKVERQYPPRIYDTSAYSLSSINGLNNISTETISISSGEYGAGNYTIYTTDTQQNKKFLFNYVINDDNSGSWGDNYTATSGTYIGTTNSINNYYGDWIIIKLPTNLILSRIRIYPFLTTFSRNPSLWKCFGSNDGLVFIEITYASNNTNGLSSSDYSNGYYEKIIPELFSTPYLYIAFVFNKLVGGDTNSTSLAIVEFQIFCRDTSPTLLMITSLFNKNFLYYSTTGNDPNYLKLSTGGIVNSNLTILGKLGIGTNNYQTSNLFIAGNANTAIIGNVGIGTTDTTAYKLNVFGSLNATSIYSNNNLIDFTSYLSASVLTIASNTLQTNINAKQDLIVSTCNLVGIGSLITNIDYNNITLNKPDLSSFTNSAAFTTLLTNNLTLSSNFTSNFTYENLNVLDTSIQKLFPPKIYNAASAQSITTYLNQTPVYYENITLTNANIGYGSGIYDIYTSSIDTNNINFTGIDATSNTFLGNSDYSYIVFPKNGTLILNTSVVCDILIVGGGGGGGTFGAGGGAGGILFATNYTIPNGTHTITIGTGGAGAPNTSQINGTNGNNSSFAISGGTTFIAVGGGGGGSRNDTIAGYPGRPGNNGGSGGGGGTSDTVNPTPPNAGGSSTQNSYFGWISYGNSGGSGINGDAGNNGYGSGGGGGAGGVGLNGINNKGGNGGVGIDMSAYFGTVVGHNGWFGGGGGGASFSGRAGYVNGFGNGGNGLFGGGGNAFAGNALANTGGGGGGGNLLNQAQGYGGNGGSGVVIIRFLKSTTKKELFNYITNDNTSYFKSFQYDTASTANNGYYLTTDRYILSGYYGDWIIIKIPYSIYLSKYRIYNKSIFVGRSPSLFKIYGSTDGTTYEEITTASNDTTALISSDYLLGYYEKIVNYFDKTYTHFGIVVKKIIGNNIDSHLLNINEFQIFGRETLPSYVPRYLLFNSTTQNFTGTLTNNGTIINNSIINGSGTIEAYSFIQNGTSLNSLLASKQDILIPSTVLNGIGSNLSLVNYATLSNLPNFSITGATGGSLSYTSGTITLAMPTNYTANISLSNLITPISFNYKGSELSTTLATYLPVAGATLTSPLNIISTTIDNQIIITNTSSSRYASIRLFNGLQNGYIGLGCTQLPGTYQSNVFIQSTNSIIFASGDTNTNTNPPKMILHSSGNLGIGTTNPILPLSVIGNAYISGFVGIGTTNPQTSNLFIAANANTAILGKVGIGTTDTTTYNLNVAGTVNATSNIYEAGTLLSTKYLGLAGGIITNNLIIANNITVERKYPSKVYNSKSGELSETGTLFNVLPLTYVKEVITLNSTGITYGSGEYIIYSSSFINDVLRERALLFNDKKIAITGVDIGSYWGYNNYTTTTGIFIGTDKYIKSDYYGEWSIIKFPNPIILTRYIIHINSIFTDRHPSLIRFYGSNDGSTFTVIAEAEISTPLQLSDYIENKYERIVSSTFKIPYLYIGFTVNKIIGNPSGSGLTHMTMMELEIFGKEQTSNNNNSFLSIGTTDTSTYPLNVVGTVNATDFRGIGTNITQLNYNNITTNKPDLSVYTTSNVCKNIILYDTPNVSKKFGFLCSLSTSIYPNGGSTQYYKYDIDLTKYTTVATLPNNDPYRIFKINIFKSSCYFGTIINDVPDIISYEIYMSNKASAGNANENAGINICAVGNPINYKLDKVMPNNLFLMKDTSTDFNTLSILSSSILEVRCIISDLLN